MDTQTEYVYSGLGLGLLYSKACGQSLERPHGGNTSLGAGVLLFWCCRASFELLPVPVPAGVSDCREVSGNSHS